MSLIEKALNKTHSANHSASLGAQGQAPSPGNLLGPSRRPPRIGLMAALGVMLGLALAGGWVLMEHWPLVLPKEQKRIRTQESPSGLKEVTKKTKDSGARETQEDLQAKEQEQPLTSSELQENSGVLPQGSIPQETHFATLPKPDLQTSGLKNPSFSEKEQRAYPPAHKKEASAPQAPRTPHGGKEKGPEVQEKQRILLEKAYIQAQAGHFHAALQIYDQLLAQDPERLEALVNRGVLRMRMGDFPGAKRDLLQAKLLRPQDPTLLNALGVLHMETGELDEAAHYFRSSSEPASLANLALLYWRKGSRERALELLEEAQARIPQEPWLAYYKALLLRESGRQKEAREELERARGLALKRGDMELVQKLEALQGGS